MIKSERWKERGNTLWKVSTECSNSTYHTVFLSQTTSNRPAPYVFQQERLKEALKEYKKVIQQLESIIANLPVEGKLVEGIHIRAITRTAQAGTHVLLVCRVHRLDVWRHKTTQYDAWRRSTRRARGGAYDAWRREMTHDDAARRMTTQECTRRRMAHLQNTGASTERNGKSCTWRRC